MMIHDITALAGPKKYRKRVGRGEGSGHGKQSGRGHKGAKARSGYARKLAFEGGQMPYFRRLPKFGFTNAPFKVKFWTVNLSDILAHPNFTGGGVVNAESLIKAGLVRDTSRDLKILGHLGDAAHKQGVKVKLHVEASRVTESAKKHIEGAGGTVKQTGTRRDKVRGIDLTSTDRTPKNLTKKLKRGSKSAKPVADEAPEAPADAKAKASRPAPKGGGNGSKGD